MKLITALGKAHQQIKALSYGDYKEQNLTTRQYTYSRSYEGTTVVVMVNNDDNPCTMHGGAPDGTYIGILSGRKITISGGGFAAEIAGNSGEIWVPKRAFSDVSSDMERQPVDVEQKAEPLVEDEKTVMEEVLEEVVETPVEEEQEEKVLDLNKPYEEMSIEELQACILAKMAKNGPVTEDMKRTVTINNHHGSLMNWVRSFNN